MNTSAVEKTLSRFIIIFFPCLGIAFLFVALMPNLHFTFLSSVVEKNDNEYLIDNGGMMFVQDDCDKFEADTHGQTFTRSKRILWIVLVDEFSHTPCVANDGGKSTIAESYQYEQSRKYWEEQRATAPITEKDNDEITAPDLGLTMVTEQLETPDRTFTVRYPKNNTPGFPSLSRFSWNTEDTVRASQKELADCEKNPDPETRFCNEGYTQTVDDFRSMESNYKNKNDVTLDRGTHDIPCVLKEFNSRLWFRCGPMGPPAATYGYFTFIDTVQISAYLNFGDETKEQDDAYFSQATLQ